MTTTAATYYNRTGEGQHQNHDQYCQYEHDHGYQYHSR